jgi:hypothetical protein
MGNENPAFVHSLLTIDPAFGVILELLRFFIPMIAALYRDLRWR